MWLYFIITVLTVLMAMQIRDTAVAANQEIRPWTFVHRGYSRQIVVNRVSMVIIFIMLFGVSAMRLNVGNDYARYVNFMHLASMHEYVPTEIGFNILTRFIYYISGYENYLLVFAVFSFVTVFLFMYSMRELAVNFGWTFMLFMLLAYYFQSLSTVRYYLALSIALFSMTFIISFCL